MDIESWKSVPFAPNYEVSSLGGVRRIADRYGRVDHKRMKANIRPDGYRMVMLYPEPRKQTPRLIHRLVLEVFAGCAPDGTHAAHINGDKSDNRLSNLRWATPKENNADKLVHGTDNRGEKHWNSRLSEDDVRFIRQQNIMPKQVAEIFGISRKYASEIRSGLKWKSVL